MKAWLPKSAMETTTPCYMAITDSASSMKSWLPGVAADPSTSEANNYGSQEIPVRVQPQPSSQRSRRLAVTRGAIRKSSRRVLRIKNRSSAHKWARQLESLRKFKKVAANLGGAPIELINWALGSNTSGKGPQTSSALETGYLSLEATIQDYTAKTLMKQIYQDIHVSSTPGLINSTSDLAFFLGRGGSDATPNENWIQLNVALQTQAVFRVIEYAMAGCESVRTCFSTANAAIHSLRVEPDTLGRTSDVVANEIRLCQRYASFAAENGWMLLAILAFSGAFREAARTHDDLLWRSFNTSICQNKNSIEYFAKVRGLNWTLALTRNPERATQITNLQEGYPSIEPDHPHTHIVPQKSRPIRKPQYKGKIQKNIISNRFRPSDFRSLGRFGRSNNPPRDPTIQRGLQCEICGSTSCHCKPSNCEGVLRPLVELVQSANNMGIGIRVLQPIRKNQLLAEYVGDIIPEDCPVDDTYSISFNLPNGAASTAVITAQENGNWTRFVNHSCDAHAIFVNRVIGNRHRIMLMSIKDIEMFEEMTVDYGNDYWVTRPTLCRCGSRKCRFATVEKRDEMAVSCGIRPIGS